MRVNLKYHDNLCDMQHKYLISPQFKCHTDSLIVDVYLDIFIGGYCIQIDGWMIGWMD